MCFGAIIHHLAILIIERLTDKFNPGKEQTSIHNIAHSQEINFSRMQLLYQVKLFICKIQCRWKCYCILIHLPSRKHDSYFAFWELTHTRNKATTFTLWFQNSGIWKWVPRVWYPTKYLLSTRALASTRSCNNFISSLPGLGKIWCKTQKQLSFSAKFWIDTTEKERGRSSFGTLEYWLLLMAMTGHYPLVVYCLLGGNKLTSAGSQTEVLLPLNVFLHYFPPFVHKTLLSTRFSFFEIEIISFPLQFCSLSLTA